MVAIADTDVCNFATIMIFIACFVNFSFVHSGSTMLYFLLLLCSVNLLSLETRAAGVIDNDDGQSGTMATPILCTSAILTKCSAYNDLHVMW